MQTCISFLEIFLQDMVMEVFGDAVVGRSGVLEWHKQFREDRERLEDDDRPGRPWTSKTDKNVSRAKN